MRCKGAITANNLHTNTPDPQTFSIHQTTRVLVNSPPVFSFLNTRDLIKPAALTNPKRWDQSISLGDNIMLLRLWSQMRAEGRVLAWGGFNEEHLRVKAIREDVPLLITGLHRVKQNNRDQGHRSRPQEGLLISLPHTHTHTLTRMFLAFSEATDAGGGGVMQIRADL